MTVKCSRIENFLVCTSPSSISKDKEGTGLRETSPFWSLNYMQEIFSSLLMGLKNIGEGEGGGQSDEEYFNMKHLLLLILKFREIQSKVLAQTQTQIYLPDLDPRLPLIPPLLPEPLFPKVLAPFIAQSLDL